MQGQAARSAPAHPCLPRLLCIPHFIPHLVVFVNIQDILLAIFPRHPLLCLLVHHRSHRALYLAKVHDMVCLAAQIMDTCVINRYQCF